MKPSELTPLTALVSPNIMALTRQCLIIGQKIGELVVEAGSVSREATSNPTLIPELLQVPPWRS